MLSQPNYRMPWIGGDAKFALALMPITPLTLMCATLWCGCFSDVAGRSWPTLARTAALALSGEGDDSDTFVTKLLQALKQDFVDLGEDHDQGFQITTEI